MNFLSRFLMAIFSIGLIQSALNADCDFCPEYITIYIHGTTTDFGLKSLSKIYPELAFGASGVHHIDALPKNALLRQDMLTLQAQNSARFDVNHFYTFGWSGALDFQKREEAGYQLYEGLITLLSEYQNKYGTIPKVQIWTMSHGGNVALNMVRHLPFFQERSVHLELILVAVPVQKVTEKLIESPYIAKSYIFSSGADLMQILDYYNYENKYYWPTRFFETKISNCYQLNILINDRGITHTDLLRSFTLHIPFALKYADEQQMAKLVHGQNPAVYTCSIIDSQFTFYNVLNLMDALYGKRKSS